MVIFFLVLIGRLFFIQVVKAEDLAYFANKQQIAMEPIKADRGSIYDRNGTILVYSRSEISFFVDPRLAHKYKKDSLIAKVLSDSIGGSFDKYKAMIDSAKKSFCILKKVDAKLAHKIKNVVYDGLFFKEDPTRVYEYKSLASHIIGFVNFESVGTDGIESVLDSRLKGKEGSRFVLKDGIGSVMSILEDNYKEALPGENVALTIDRAIQGALETELETGVKNANAEYATGIVMDPNTGEVLALANYSGYEPGNYKSYSDEIRRNKAISDVYEPGSTFKGIALSGILDKKIASPNQMVNTENGRYKFLGKEIKDHHAQASMSVREVLRYSSNIGMVKLSMKMPDNEFFLYLRSFGFGNFTYLGLPGEVKGRLSIPSEWSGTTKGTMSYGYGISVTPIQLITAYSAIINGGYLYKPLLIKEIKDSKGNVIERNNPTKIRSVITEETSKIMRDLLYDVVEKGTGKRAIIKGLKIGGKTGTSRKIVNGKYSQERYNSSFIGFFPADNPKYICLILVNTPKSVGITGGEVAAPVFRNVVKKIIAIDPSIGKNVDLSKIDDDNKDKAKETDEKDVESIQPDEVKDTVVKKEEFIIKKIDLNNLGNTKMPNLKGVSLKEAISVMKKLGIEFTYSGSGRVIEQSLKPNSEIKKGLKIHLKLQENVISGVNIY
jgi:cell division protein FtsI/penicillin-binding protein 2